MSIIVSTTIVGTIMKLEQELKMDFKSRHEKAMLNIIFTGVWLTNNLSTHLKPSGISHQQFNVLRILRGQKGNPVNLYLIQERMVHRSSNTTRLVQKLLDKGLVNRLQDENNRRKIEITITQKGVELLDDFELIHEKYRNTIHKKMNAKEAGFLAEILDKLRE